MSHGFTKAVPIDTDPTMAANTDLLVPSQAAVVAYVANAIPTAVVTAVTAAAPVISTGGATPTISMPQASASQSGYLSAADFATFSAGGGGFDQKKIMAYIAAY
jgi:hypothetical protein